MTTLIKNATVVNEGRTFHADILIEDDLIREIAESGATPAAPIDNVIDAAGAWLLPGVIDDHVHFREPGMTDKADIASESRAAAAGGVTSYMDMPNTIPQTTTMEAWLDKMDRARSESRVNYAFFFGATNDNADSFHRIDTLHTPGIKLFMGSSTGNMLVDKKDALERIFAEAPLPIMTHCEDTQVINQNMAVAKRMHGDDPDITFHPAIRSEEACWLSTSTAVEMAQRHGTRLHVAHISTARELQLFDPADWTITAEATSAHILFDNSAYSSKGALIKVNPAVKTRADRDAIRNAMADGRIKVVGTDHAPHLISQKQGGAAKATSGMPMVQFSLVAMLRLVDEGVITIERLVELMAHNPARIFRISRRGFIRQGYKADLVIVRRAEPWTIERNDVLSKCGWSPMEGERMTWTVERTICNGLTVYSDGRVMDDVRGEALEFGDLHD